LVSNNICPITEPKESGELTLALNGKFSYKGNLLMTLWQSLLLGRGYSERQCPSYETGILYEPHKKSLTYSELMVPETVDS
jgi:hypothetical protein